VLRWVVENTVAERDLKTSSPTSIPTLRVALPLPSRQIGPTSDSSASLVWTECVPECVPSASPVRPQSASQSTTPVSPSTFPGESSTGSARVLLSDVPSELPSVLNSFTEAVPEHNPSISAAPSAVPSAGLAKFPAHRRVYLYDRAIPQAAVELLSTDAPSSSPSSGPSAVTYWASVSLSGGRVHLPVRSE
jgi:hypothetical protein